MGTRVVEFRALEPWSLGAWGTGYWVLGTGVLGTGCLGGRERLGWCGAGDAEGGQARVAQNVLPQSRRWPVANSFSRSRTSSPAGVAPKYGLHCGGPPTVRTRQLGPPIVRARGLRLLPTHGRQAARRSGPSPARRPRCSGRQPVRRTRPNRPMPPRVMARRSIGTRQAPPYNQHRRPGDDAGGREERARGAGRRRRGRWREPQRGL